jgi:septal ring factor EnvC (AmiA/AmiB activator)
MTPQERAELVELVRDAVRSELQVALAPIEKRFDGIEQRLDKVEQRLDQVEQRLDRVEQRLDRVEQRLDRVEQRLDKVEQRLDNIETNMVRRDEFKSLFIEAFEPLRHRHFSGIQATSSAFGHRE